VATSQAEEMAMKALLLIGDGDVDKLPPRAST